MPKFFTCRHCGKILPRNPRLKKHNTQSYCNAPGCKQAKKSARKKERYHTDSDYRQRHLDRQKLWRVTRPAHEYQKQYRETHPEYADRNRELQAQRNCRRKKESDSSADIISIIGQRLLVRMDPTKADRPGEGCKSF